MQIPNIRNAVNFPVNYFFESSWKGKTVQVLFAASIVTLIYYFFRNKTPPKDSKFEDITLKSRMQKKQQANPPSNQTQIGQATTYTPDEFKRLLREKHHFPPNVIVAGDLIFKKNEVVTLPTGLTVKGQLYLSGNKNLKALPQGLKVEGSLWLDSCTGLTTLPENLEVTAIMNLSGCTGLTTLPRGLKVGGDLRLARCTGLTAMPEDLEVKCDLDFTGCIRLKQLSQKPPKVGNGMFFYECTGLTSLPSWITTLGSIHKPVIVNLLNTGLSDAIIEELRRTPAPGVRFVLPYRKVDPSLIYTPENFKKLLRQNYQFPPNVVVSGSLDLTNIPIQTLPTGLEVRGSMDLKGSGLIALPEGLEVAGDLELGGCRFLTTLPEGLKVKGGLNLSFTGLTSLPQTPPEIGNKLWLYECTGLTSLPNWITTLGLANNGNSCFTRIVELENTGLSYDIIERLIHLDAPGMRFLYANAATKPTVRFSTVDKALDFWLKEAKDEKLALPNITIDRELDRANVIKFLERLTTTAEYDNLQTRTHLACRILEAFHQLALDDELKARACIFIHHGLTSCDDRIISALEEIELMLLLHKIENTKHTAEELEKLGKSFLLLEMVNAKAKAHKETLTWVDEIEIYLTFQISLAERFNLPVKTRNMIFRRCAQVTDAQLEAFGDEIEQACTDEKLEAFLKTWSPWLKFQRQLVPSYEELAITDRELAEDDICVFSQCAPEQPVFYNGHVYDYEDFAQQYRTDGRDPTDRSKIDLSQLKRIIKK